MTKFKEGDRVRLQGTVEGTRIDDHVLIHIDGRIVNLLIPSGDVIPIPKGMRIFIFVGVKEGEHEVGDSVTIEGSKLRQRTCAQMAGDLVERLMTEFELEAQKVTE